MMREYHVRICEGLGVKLPGSTRQFANGRLTNIAAMVATAVVLLLNVILILQTSGVPIPGLPA